VVLLHGGGQSRHSGGGAFQARAREDFQVVSFDGRGHGESDWSQSGAYDLSDRVGDLRKILDGIDAPYVLVGASLGGATAICAVDEGARPAGLVLVDIVPEPEPEGIRRIVSFMSRHPRGFATLEDAADAVAAYNPERKRPANPEGLMKNLRKREDGRLYWHWDPRIVALAPETHHQVVRTATQTLESLHDLPVLLVRGLTSDVVSDHSVARFREQVPRLEVFDVEGAGHMVAGHRNDAFNEGVLSFVRRVLRSHV
jgi:pimeloyl-ACP methyl ester carboxylesterase